MRIIVNIPCLFCALLVSCSVSPEPVGDTYQATSTLLTQRPTSTQAVALTPTLARTEIPGFTPTEGPAPDLEIVNFTLDAQMNLMADIRNNTNETMIFPQDDIAFEFYIDYWWLNFLDHFGPMKVDPGGQTNKHQSCFLYPGETGVLSVNARNFCGETCNVTRDELTEETAQETTRLKQYTGFYKRWDDIKEKYPASWTPLFEGYHPKAENIAYEVQGETININFDLDIVLPEIDTRYVVQSWIVLYDKDGRIINVLQTNIHMTTGGYFITGNYHIEGIGSNAYCSSSSPVDQCWRAQVKLTEESLKNLNHIRILVDLNSVHLCEYGRR